MKNKKKLHWLAVAEGLKTGNGKGPILSECLVAVSLYKSIAAGLLWVVSRKNQNHRRDVREARRRAVSFILSNLDQRLVRKKNSGKKKGCSYYLLHVPRVIGQKFSQKQKAAKERKKSEMSLLLFLVNWVGSWKRRLVAEEGSLSKKTWLQKINRGW